MAKALCFGAQLAALPPAELGALARRIETLGYDSLWVPDHLSFHYPVYEAMTHLAFVAAATERVRLGTAVLLLPLRSAGLAAKQIATVDALSGGRVIVGLGVGGEARVEYELCGVPRAERGDRATEAMRVLRLLWSGEPTDFVGRFSRFKGAKIDPPPVQKGGPPLWVGGRSAAALRRAARLGDGYVSYVLTPDRIRGAFETIQREAEAAHRPLDGFDRAHLFFVNVNATYEAALDQATAILTDRYQMDFREPSRKYNILGPPAACAEQLGRYADAGVRHFILSPTVPREALGDQFETLAREVLPALRSLVVLLAFLPFLLAGCLQLGFSDGRGGQYEKGSYTWDLPARAPLPAARSTLPAAIAKHEGLVLFVNKASHRLYVYANRRLQAEYPVSFGRRSEGHKRYQGDRRTPEGTYRVTVKKNLGQTRFHRALLLNYPNDRDRRLYREAKKQGRVPGGRGIGGLIEVHGGGTGVDWTDGCIALENEDMDKLFGRVRVGTPVVIVADAEAREAQARR